MSQKLLFVGDPVPDFTVRSSNNPKFYFNTAAGRYLVLSFFGSAGDPKALQALKHMVSRRKIFDDDNASFFGVSIDPEDEARQRIRQSMPGIRFFWDFDRAVSTLCGALDDNMAEDEALAQYRPFTLVIDPMLRVLATIPLNDPEEHNKAFDFVLSQLPGIQNYAAPAPVLILPRVFEREFCRHLIKLYEGHGGDESCFVRNVDGKTVSVLDNTFKRRKDFSFDDQPEHKKLRSEISNRLNRRLVPEIRKVFQFHATRIERFIVACYDSQVVGFFQAHRDDTTPGTRHRRFACTLNLNAEDYEGGNLRFPEFGQQTYRAPTGGAVIFSCSLLHEATPVTKGTRYAFLPFLYDHAASRIRQQNLHAISDELIDKNKESDDNMIQEVDKQVSAA